MRWYSATEITTAALCPLWVRINARRVFWTCSISAAACVLNSLTPSTSGVKWGRLMRTL